MERATGWQQIRQDVKEAERLIARKEYSLVMVRVRQVLEYTVKCMAKGAYVAERGSSDTIDQLYEDQWINKAAKDNYHTIHILGNEVVHEGDGAAYDANQALQLLIQEVYVFVNGFAGSTGSRAAGSSPAAENTSGRPAPRQGSSGSRSASSRNGQRVSAKSTRSSPSRRGGSGRKHRHVSPTVYILRLLIPVLLIILLIVAIHVFTPGKDREADRAITTPAVITAPVETAPTLPPELKTEPETEPPVETYRIKGNSVNVRSKPSTSGRILVQLSNGAEVVYVKRCDNDWAVIDYDDQGTHVSSKFIRKVEPVTSTRGETGGSEAQTDNQAGVFVKIIQKKLVILNAKKGRV